MKWIDIESGTFFGKKMLPNNEHDLFDFVSNMIFVWFQIKDVTINHMQSNNKQPMSSIKAL